ncbi:MAG: lipid-A-disaccharide synthase-related protein [Armatimonadota bacterium]
MDKNILVLSNGYGEDEIAAQVISEIKKADQGITVYALPLVGKGHAYNNVDVKKLGPTKLMPSGGLVPSNHAKMLFNDVKAGLIGLTFGQINSILKIRSKTDLSLSVGDSYPVILNSFFTKRKQIFVGTAKSNYFCPYSDKEKKLFKKYCDTVFPRDEVTASDLRDYGINAVFAGNVMMDCINPVDCNMGTQYPQVVVGILPGSREDVYKDFSMILQAVEVLGKKVNWDVKYFTALASSVDMGDMVAPSISLGWELTPTNYTKGIVGELKKGNSTVYLTRGIFGDIITRAHIIMGQAGTANEQAVGLGKPVVAFSEKTPDGNLGWYRLRQKGLLGDALSVVDKDPVKIAGEVISILENPAKYEYMAKIGRERMGPPGGAKKIAQKVIQEINV